MPDGSILLIADDSAPALGLAHELARLMPCIAMRPEDPPPPGPHAAVVLDLGPAEVALGTGLRRSISGLRARGVPCLGLARDAPAAALARARGAATVLNAHAPSHVIAREIADAIAGEAAARAREPLWQTRIRAAEASTLVTQAFHAATAGRAISREDIDLGTEIVLDAMSEAGIRAWLDVIQAHAISVYQHSLGVAGYAAALAGRLGFRHQDQMRLVRAALLHDVGKARIPHAILDKPSSLTEEEMAVMRTHPVIGAQLLARQPGFDAETLDVVRHHHEMLDGSGYPDGLSGRAIGDLVRLVTICDIFSALTERRPYRAPMAAEEAWAVMERMGPKLDAALLAAFRPVAQAGAVARAA
ncbi:HD-GYP domain-containing protein [Methylobacterium sp. WSM2598]|uniref:HD-GYP domain-containing protein n=1 Tax=Methylobacterium sp. WSM2598 TaxID=398261 RepID=UPI00037F6475|nr:HD domain-containing phosphohydrolase [Methylobacterium sp. WSM2598]